MAWCNYCKKNVQFGVYNYSPYCTYCAEEIKYLSAQDQEEYDNCFKNEREVKEKINREREKNIYEEKNKKENKIAFKYLMICLFIFIILIFINLFVALIFLIVAIMFHEPIIENFTK